MQLSERVAAGTAWLDEHYPGWPDHVDLSRLHMGSGEWCLLAQVGKNMARSQLNQFAHDHYAWWQPPFADMADMHGMSWERPTELGFSLDCQLGDVVIEPTAGNYLELKLAWMEVILARRQDSSVEGCPNSGGKDGKGKEE